MRKAVICMKRLAVFVLSVCLLLSMIPVALASPLPFGDVSMGDWFFEEVAYVYNAGLMSGTSETVFSPSGTTTRGMIVTILHRMEGKPDGTGTFSDVASGDYYAKAVAWAADNGIVSGYGNGRFGPGDAITREQLAAILYRYAQNCGRNMERSGDLSAFADEDKVSAYAVQAMQWAVGEGLISGVGSGMLDPAGTATRAQAAAILSRFCKAAPLPQPEQPKPEEPTSEKPDEQIADEDILLVAGETYHLGMDTSKLPDADEMLPSVYGFTWYVFGTEDYAGFFAAGVRNGKVVALTSSGDSFSYLGYEAGDQNTEGVKELFADQHDQNAIHGVLLLSDGIWEGTLTADALAGESKMLLHLTNGFRLHHGQSQLQWCDVAAEAARLHSVDMADNNYFSHDSQNGTKFYERMKSQGLAMETAGENIAASTIGMASFEAYHGWVNSLSHREVMLGDYTHLGVGGGYNASATWSCCYTQDFYR